MKLTNLRTSDLLTHGLLATAHFIFKILFYLLLPCFGFTLPLHRKISDLKFIFTNMSYLTKEKITNIFKDFGGKEQNTGSIAAQVALLTERINGISAHMKANKKDFSSNRGLMKMVGQRKRLLAYMSRTNLTGYRELLEKLGLRK